MMRTQFIIAGLLALTFAETAIARPVSYPGGWTLMQRNNGDSSSAHLHYSPTASDSLGIYVEKNWTDDLTFTGLQYNRLIKRWNGPGSQANFYGKMAAGSAKPFDDGEAKLSGFIELAADWETRRWFTQYKIRASDFANDKTVHHSARVGVAPYIGDYGDLHTWLMLQVDNHPDRESSVTTTPLIRLFKGVQMVELGYTIEENEWTGNWIVRF